jgi:hypothetical protein
MLRVVNFDTTDPAQASYRVSVDAAGLTATVGSTKYTLAKNAACDYTASAVGRRLGCRDPGAAARHRRAGRQL